MRYLTVLFIALFFVNPNFAQDKLVTCSSERNPDNSISIYSDSRIVGDYTVKLSFPVFSGYTSSVSILSDVIISTIHKGRMEVAKLTPIKGEASHAMQYLYSWYPGMALRRRPNTTFTYLIPASEGTDVRVYSVKNVAERLGQKNAEDLSITGFAYKLSDTICAARAGVVYEASDENKESEKAGQVYRAGRNRVMIQQKDGTLAGYTITAPIQLLVNAGDYVIPGQPIAIFNTASERYHVFFSVMYLDEKKILVNSTQQSAEEKRASAYSHIPALFYTDDTKTTSLELNKHYTAMHPKEVVGIELSKKDKKKLGL